ncbi:cobalamin biosynthesis protein [Pseudomonas costantinii]|uniref:Cobalamin biosynthesis protein CobE n=1 Tax=Pseudomonas costantinii TaxID=168469 RepID=A0A1S2UMG6_9PSED|nr:cobalamin biosynthesis protein [Pseudomonas costantinii]NVZ21397.1 cobalamin biosynthesis protein [Pseudomonas costantinii]NVZ71324.1 cobalamin biosynthesis protein [Pseudomonas costantinii]OIN47425.1 cobalamin biosynthesis protein CobE [Pseudomonas costantinii]SEE48084.1 cobalt-precorrin 5A hydrolase [Pseudomonas costantinii]
MTLVVGLGCQRGCDVQTLLDLFETALAEGGIERRRITALASIDRKQDEPGLLALAQLLNLPLRCFSAEQLAIYEDRLSHKSTVAFTHTGCYGIAESAALALTEHLCKAPARLLITRQKSAQATFALACPS